jgi:hypothetical protein
MLATRAMAHLRLGETEEAATWALNAVGRPNAHVHIRAIAACCLAAASRLDEARAFAAQIQAMQPNYRLEDFLQAFHYSPEAEAVFRQAAARIGMA